MSTLIVYVTKHDFTAKCVMRLSKQLDDNFDILNLREKKDTKLEHYDSVIIGGPIYMGQIMKEVKEFCEKNLQELSKKKIGLFVCGMSDEDKINSFIEQSFPQKLKDRASAKGDFGGSFIFKSMNFFERFIIKHICKTNKDILNLKEHNIDEFAAKMNTKA
ncbi:flavodoxin domain-containing protein [Clostridium guangxiense]|uniref:flavodoxin domain-containing protein n=1 Tax=Clostridium guangxiense TaxID=1662055 RepID=UPI001E432918|nr:flavodoxin domain-containing protein [Clostridium guangxiense]MCD2346648.1 flavodoxin domain-containing protein [Clostridium guangxiense]